MKSDNTNAQSEMGTPACVSWYFVNAKDGTENKENLLN